MSKIETASTSAKVLTSQVVKSTNRASAPLINVKRHGNRETSPASSLSSHSTRKSVRVSTYSATKNKVPPQRLATAKSNIDKSLSNQGVDHGEDSNPLLEDGFQLVARKHRPVREKRAPDRFDQQPDQLYRPVKSKKVKDCSTGLAVSSSVRVLMPEKISRHKSKMEQSTSRGCPPAIVNKLPPQGKVGDPPSEINVTGADDRQVEQGVSQNEIPEKTTVQLGTGRVYNSNNQTTNNLDSVQSPVPGVLVSKSQHSTSVGPPVRLVKRKELLRSVTMNAQSISRYNDVDSSFLQDSVQRTDVENLRGKASNMVQGHDAKVQSYLNAVGGSAKPNTSDDLIYQLHNASDSLRLNDSAMNRPPHTYAVSEAHVENVRAELECKEPSLAGRGREHGRKPYHGLEPTRERSAFKSVYIEDRITTNVLSPISHRSSVMECGTTAPIGRDVSNTDWADYVESDSVIGDDVDRKFDRRYIRAWCRAHRKPGVRCHQ